MACDTWATRVIQGTLAFQKRWGVLGARQASEVVLELELAFMDFGPCGFGAQSML